VRPRSDLLEWQRSLFEQALCFFNAQAPDESRGRFAEFLLAPSRQRPRAQAGVPRELFKRRESARVCAIDQAGFAKHEGAGYCATKKVLLSLRAFLAATGEALAE
jgi:hypothetical protein